MTNLERKVAEYMRSGVRYIVDSRGGVSHVTAEGYALLPPELLRGTTEYLSVEDAYRASAVRRAQWAVRS